jgi:hypothetical protein
MQFGFPLSVPCPPSLEYLGPLRPAGWDHWLQHHPDQGFRNSLLDIIRFGVKIGYTGPLQHILSENLPTAKEDPATLSSDIQKRVANKQILLVSTNTPPEPPFISSPLGLTPKSDGTWRRIHHLSAPRGSSVNDHIPKEWASLTYTTFDQAMKLVAEAGPGAWLVKRDLADAFKHIPVNPSDWWLLGFEWEGSWWADLRLPFGLRTSPAIFDLFASGLDWILASERGWTSLLHYLDDFLAVLPPQQPLIQRYKQDFQSICDDLGLQVKDAKSEEGTTVSFLGIELDTVLMEARLPQEKYEKATTLVAETLHRSSVKYSELESLVGFLAFASKVVRSSRPFLREMYTALSRTPRTHHIRITGDLKKDLAWWDEFLPQWNGITMLPSTTAAAAAMQVWTDASGSKGLGGYFLQAGQPLTTLRKEAHFSIATPTRHQGKHIDYKEMYAILHALRLWHTSFAGQTIEFFCDNEAVVAALRKGSIKSAAIEPLRKIAMLTAIHHIHFTVTWLPTNENCLADALSRFDSKKIANLCPALM